MKINLILGLLPFLSTAFGYTLGNVGSITITLRLYVGLRGCTVIYNGKREIKGSALPVGNTPFSKIVVTRYVHNYKPVTLFHHRDIIV